MSFATPSLRRTWIAVGVLALATVGPVRAAIFEWEHVDPADPSLGKRESTTLVPSGAGSNGVPVANLRYRNLAKAYLIDKDLTGTNFFGATLIGADLSRSILTGTDFERASLAGAELVGANIRGTNFSNTTSQGFAAAQLYATASYQARDLTGIGFTYNDLSGWDFVGQNLNNAYFYRATLTDADLTDAEVHSAYFDDTTRFGFTASQLYATASYQAYDLAGIHLGYNDLSSWNFSGQSLFRASFYAAALTNANLSHANLTNADFLYATLSGADMTGADMRGARGLPVPPDAVADNLIRSDGRIFGLDLQAGERLLVRDYDGRSSTSPSPILIPIRVTNHFAMVDGGVLRMVFEADDWDSTISFDAGIPVDLGGVLELAFAADVDLASQVGRTFQLFDWAGVTPVGLFDGVESDYVWDLSQLYASGDVTLVALTTAPAGDYNGDGVVDGLDYDEWRVQYGSIVAPGVGADGNGDGVVDAADYTVWRDELSAANESSTAVPEPASLVMSVLAAAALVGAGGGRVLQLCPRSLAVSPRSMTGG